MKKNLFYTIAIIVSLPLTAYSDILDVETCNKNVCKCKWIPEFCISLNSNVECPGNFDCEVFCSAYKSALECNPS